MENKKYPFKLSTLYDLQKINLLNIKKDKLPEYYVHFKSHVDKPLPYKCKYEIVKNRKPNLNQDVLPIIITITKPEFVGKISVRKDLSIEVICNHPEMSRYVSGYGLMGCYKCGKDDIES